MIYEVHCTECDFTASAMDRLGFALRDDGREVLLPQWEEHRIAFEFTGKRLIELAAQGLLRYREGYLCLACGAVGYYGFENGLFAGVTDTDFEDAIQEDEILYDFVQSERVHRSSRLRCLACASESLEVAGGPKGFAAEIGKMFLGERRWRQRQQSRERLPRCPWCERGRLYWQDSTEA
jgi:hypothetical protein